MIITAQKHVFGHQGQYKTLLASPELRPEEITELEQFQFGQTNDQSYLNSLARNPALILRPLKTGRFALTRVSRGPDDDAGRNTLLFTTLVVPAFAWVRSLAANLIELLTAQADTWDATTPTISLPSPEPFPVGKGYNVETADWAGAQLKSLHGTRTALWAFSDVINIRVLAHLLAQMPPASRERFSFAYRSLSDGLPVALNSLERQYIRSGTGRVGVWFLGNELTPRTKAISKDQEPGERTGNSSFPNTTQPSPLVEQEDSMPRGHQLRPLAPLLSIALVVLLLSQGFMGWMLIRQSRKLDQLSQSQSQTVDGLNAKSLPGQIQNMDQYIREGATETRRYISQLADNQKTLGENVKQQVREDLANQFADLKKETKQELDNLVKAIDSMKKNVEPGPATQKPAEADEFKKLHAEFDKLGALPGKVDALAQSQTLLQDWVGKLLDRFKIPRDEAKQPKRGNGNPPGGQDQ